MMWGRKEVEYEGITNHREFAVCLTSVTPHIRDITTYITCICKTYNFIL